MPSPTCLINKYPTSEGYTAASLTSLPITLADKNGVNSWKLTIIGTDNDHSVATENGKLIYNSTTRNYNYTSTTDASTIIFQSVINGGFRLDGTFDSSYITKFTVSVPTSDGYKLIAANQSTEDGENGWSAQINSIIAAGINAEDYAVHQDDISILNLTIPITPYPYTPEGYTKIYFQGPLTLNTTTVTENVYEVTSSDTVIFLNAGEATEVQLPKPYEGTDPTEPDNIESGSIKLYIISMDGRSDHTLTCDGYHINGATDPVSIPTYGITVVSGFAINFAVNPITHIENPEVWAQPATYTYNWTTLIN